MVVGSDGGITISRDAGRNWDYVDTIPMGQFYEIAFDMQKPYHLCGGLQDNDTWCGPSATTYTRGITNDEWEHVGGGDGFYAQIDPADPKIVYAESQDGNVSQARSAHRRIPFHPSARRRRQSAALSLPVECRSGHCTGAPGVRGHWSE